MQSKQQILTPAKRVSLSTGVFSALFQAGVKACAKLSAPTQKYPIPCIGTIEFSYHGPTLFALAQWIKAPIHTIISRWNHITIHMVLYH